MILMTGFIAMILTQGTFAIAGKLLWPTQIQLKRVFLIGYLRVQVVLHAIFLCNLTGLVFM